MISITLKSNTDLNVCSDAIRECHDTIDKSDKILIHQGNCHGESLPKFFSGEKDNALIDRVGNQMKHASTLEHLNYTFQVSGVSRALLQELARHRIASYTVKSSRYTLKELNKEEPFIAFTNKRDEDVGFDWDRIDKYIVMTSDERVNEASARALENLRWIISEGVSNDIAKFCMPESYKTSLTWTINARSLQNFLQLRSAKSAMWEIQEMSKKVFEALPKDHKYLFENNIFNLEEIHNTVLGS